MAGSAALPEFYALRKLLLLCGNQRKLSLGPTGCGCYRQSGLRADFGQPDKSFQLLR